MEEYSKLKDARITAPALPAIPPLLRQPESLSLKASVVTDTEEKDDVDSNVETDELQPVHTRGKTKKKRKKRRVTIY
jgi:hypothetical protein